MLNKKRLQLLEKLNVGVILRIQILEYGFFFFEKAKHQRS